MCTVFIIPECLQQFCPGVYSGYSDGLAGTGLNGMRPLVAGTGGLVDPRTQAALAAGLPPTGKP